MFQDICGIISNSGPNGEPLACGYTSDHVGPHSWSTLPTWEQPGTWPAMAHVNGEHVVQQFPVRRLEPGEHRDQN